MKASFKGVPGQALIVTGRKFFLKIYIHTQAQINADAHIEKGLDIDVSLSIYIYLYTDI